MSTPICAAPALQTAPLPSTDMPAATLPTKTPNAAPFLLRVQDVDLLTQSDGFAILRRHLDEHYKYELCDAHTPAHLEDTERWLMVRDILHALLVPVVELFDKSCSVAAAVTRATKLEDLEYAFTGQSRSAFVWLQCFLSTEKERDWCHTRGCPACVVDRSLDSEFCIRLLYAACLLSDVHYPFTIEGPTLPSFMFFLESLERAIEDDELYGEGFFELMQPKAIATRDGIEDLILQCLELDALISQPSSPDASSPESSLPASPIVGPLGGTPGMKVKRSKMARQQLTLQKEEEQWMEDMLRKCWDQLQPLVQNGLMPLPSHTLDATVKAQPEVAVRELAPA